MTEQPTLKNRTIFCHDNLPVLRGINSNSIDLIYLDPPFNKGKAFHAPTGSQAEGAEFDDIWHEESVKNEWHIEIKDRLPNLYHYLNAVGMIGSRSAKYYLIYMTVRLLEIHRILKETGSVYLHCDPTASHYLKLLLDTIFGHNRFRNEIVWHYRRWTAGNKNFQKMHDIVFRYTKSVAFQFNVQYEPYGDWIKKDYGYVDEETGKRWRWHTVKGNRYKVFLEDENRGVKLNDVWLIPYIGSTSKERTGYPTQKPLALLERIIKASSPLDGLVLDPFCGCATTCIAAELEGRQWVGIDVSSAAFRLVKERMKKEVPPDLVRGKPIYREDIPTRSDTNYKRTPTKNDKDLLYGKQNGKCKGCSTLFDKQHLEIDHIIPQIHGGGSEIENLQLLCGHCNRLKGDRPMEYLKQRLKEI